MAGKAQTRVLIVEDDEDLAFGLRLNLELEGHVVHVAHSAQDAITAAAEVRPDLIILDIILPDLDGLSLLSEWRPANPDPRVIVLSGKAEESTKIAALRLGADDYITKPFSLLELLERVAVQLRRSEHSHQCRRILHLGAACIDMDSRTVEVGRSVQRLRPKEYELLDFLLRARGSVLTRADLLKHVWGCSTLIHTNTIEYHIAQLRKKIEFDPRHPEYIVTVSKVGYRLQVDS
jgi:DNA-binding response OmpR family regulator